jgi:putative hydrolase of the HAD superfamily
MKTAILFDLGNTLVRYFTRAEFPAILEQGLTEVQDHLRQAGHPCPPAETVRQRAQEENREAPDDRVRPLAGRLGRIYELDTGLPAAAMAELCRSFLRPFLATGRCYDDTLPTLEQLRAVGFRTAIVSNLPWGSPPGPWREEVARQGLSGLVDAAIFCSDVGWRKPARQIFEFALERLGAVPEECLFVGDNPRWDVEGPRALGIDALLIDRHNLVADPPGESIESLDELWDRLQAEERGESRWTLNL